MALDRVTYRYHTPFTFSQYMEAMANLELKGINPIDVIISIIKGIHTNDLYFTRNFYVMKNIHPGLDYAYLHNHYLTIERCISLLVKPIPIPLVIVIAQLDEEGFIVDYVY